MNTEKNYGSLPEETPPMPMERDLEANKGTKKQKTNKKSMDWKCFLFAGVTVAVVVAGVFIVWEFCRNTKSDGKKPSKSDGKKPSKSDDEQIKTNCTLPEKGYTSSSEPQPGCYRNVGYSTYIGAALQCLRAVDKPTMKLIEESDADLYKALKKPEDVKKEDIQRLMDKFKIEHKGNGGDVRFALQSILLGLTEPSKTEDQVHEAFFFDQNEGEDDPEFIPMQLIHFDKKEKSSSEVVQKSSGEVLKKYHFKPPPKYIILGVDKGPNEDLSKVELSHEVEIEGHQYELKAYVHTQTAFAIAVTDSEDSKWKHFRDEEKKEEKPQMFVEGVSVIMYERSIV